MCYCNCKYESEFTGECTLNSIDCKAEKENRIEEIKEDIKRWENEKAELENRVLEIENEILELESELEELEG